MSFQVADRTICLETLRQGIARLEGTWHRGGGSSIGSGCAALDQALPWRGFRQGALVEWLSRGEGAGAWTLALLAAREACRNGGMLVVMDNRREFCPPAAVRLGIELEKMIVIHAKNTADADWAMDQALRSSVVAAVLAWPEKLSDRTFRRWQLAAEEGGGLGLLLRPETARVTPSWADVRLLVEPLATAVEPQPAGGLNGCVSKNETIPFAAHTVQNTTTNHGHVGDLRRLRMVVLHCRGGTDGRCVDVEFDDETHLMHPATPWAESTVGRTLRAV